MTSVSYDLDKQYSNSRNGTTELTTVTKPQENMLVYSSKVPSNGWCIENSTVFSQDGIVATLRNLNSNVTTTKYYKKIRSAQWCKYVDSFMKIAFWIFISFKNLNNETKTNQGKMSTVCPTTELL